MLTRQRHTIMNDKQLDQVVRHLAGQPQPTDADRQITLRALSDAMRTEHLQRRPRLSGWPFRPVPAMIASAVVILALVVVALQITRPTAAEAALGEIATAAELVEPATIPDQQYAYSQSESLVLGVAPPEAFPQGRERPLAYLLPTDRETWIGADGTVQLRTTTGTPRFFSSADETDYYRAGLDRLDLVGETTTETFDNVVSILDERAWPTTPSELVDAIRQSLPQGHDRPESVGVLDLALDLVRLPDAPPPLRAAALGVIAGLDLTLAERRPDGGGTFTISYDEPRPTTISVTLDGAGHVLHESITLIDGDPTLSIPPHTITAETTYQPIQLVNTLGSS